ncbi:MAG TPA: PAS domain-containing protein [Aliidongia sp.]|nr:PAS domain-containing protein [Aliidongia sp.]
MRTSDRTYSIKPPELLRPRAVTGDFAFEQHLEGTGLKLCFDFWKSRRLEGALPLKSSIDPVEMPRSILPNLFLHEWEGPGKFRCRLAGTEICRVTRRNPTGLYLHEQVSPEASESRLDLFKEVIDRATPAVYGGRISTDPRNGIQFKRLLLPVSRDGSRADFIFGMLIFPYFDPSLELAVNPDLDFVEWSTVGGLPGQQSPV